MEICERCEKVRPHYGASKLCKNCYCRVNASDVLCVVCNKIGKLQGRGMCRKCYLADPETRAKKNAARREKYKNDPAYREQTKAMKARALSLPHSVKQYKEYTRQRVYGITPAEYDALLTSQGGACAICRLTLDDGADKKHQRPHVDHDHSTGAVRGILCGQCNLGLGAFQDSVDVLEAAKAYLGRPAKTKE